VLRLIVAVAVIWAGIKVWEGWPEVASYMAADDLTKTDYLIAKMNRQPFEFPSKP